MENLPEGCIITGFDPERPRKEGRMKIVTISQQLILEVLNWKNKPHGYMLALPVTDDLPPDCEVVDVYYDHSYRSLLAVVSHPSFEPIPPGFRLPFATGYLTELRQIVLEKGVDQ